MKISFSVISVPNAMKLLQAKIAVGGSASARSSRVLSWPVFCVNGPRLDAVGFEIDDPEAHRFR